MKAKEFLRRGPWLEASSGPRYLRLRKRIEEGIESGLLAPDTPLQPERAIAALTGLSRVTVRKAIGELVEKGSVVQRQGSGSYVASALPRVEQSLSRLTSFTEDMARRGLQPESRWLERGLFPPSPDESVALALAPADAVARLVRLRMADGRPMAIERAALPPDILPDPSRVSGSLYEFLAETGNRPARALQKISALNLLGQDAAMLGVAPGMAGLRIERTSLLPSGRAIEFTRSIYRGDAYDFVAELRLVEKQEHP